MYMNNIIKFSLTDENQIKLEVYEYGHIVSSIVFDYVEDVTMYIIRKLNDHRITALVCDDNLEKVKYYSYDDLQIIGYMTSTHIYSASEYQYNSGVIA